MKKTKSAYDRHYIYQVGSRGYGYNPNLREWELYEMDSDGSIQDLVNRVKTLAEAKEWTEELNCTV